MSKDESNSTFIHGIAASQALDSSGERIIIEGIDISSLVNGNGGVFNYEHKSENSSQIVGKILEAKKILKRSDCENDDHKYFWDKVKMPFLYVAGELFDAVGHSGAKDVAAMLKYDEKNKGNIKQLINFSIEGSRLEKRGSEIAKCIARKVTITLTPCNHTASAELKTSDTKEGKDSSDSDKFSFINDIIMEKGEHMSSVKLHKNMANYNPKRTFTPQNAPDKIKAGDRVSYKDQPRAKTGAEIYGKPPKEPKFGMGKSKKEGVEDIKIDLKKEKKKKKHTGKVSMPAKEAVDEHEKLVDVLDSPSHKDDKKEAKKQKKELKEYKEQLPKKKGKMEKSVLQTIRDKYKAHRKKKAVESTAKRVQSERQKEGRKFDPDRQVVANKKKTLVKAKVDQQLPPEQREKTRKERRMASSGPGYSQKDAGARAKMREKMKLDKYESNMRKALTASMGMGAPSTLTGGAALQGENIDKKKKKKDKKEVQKIMKMISEEAYKRFEKKEDLIKFLSSKLPKLDKNQVLALAKTVAYVSEQKKAMKLRKLTDDE